MSRRLIRILPALVLSIMSSGAWAIGLGDITLDSALNEPLRAEIQLLSATPEELQDLKISLASADTFERYGLDRPAYLQGIQFNIVRGNGVVQLRTPVPITEPFLTFIVEANWPRGRLLREYTVLLDPPTFAPPAAQQAPAVQAPSRSTTADSGRIERQPAAAPPPPQPAPRATPPSTTRPQPLPAADDSPYDTTEGGDVYVQRGDTLWGVASRVRPDSRLTMNQTMMAIFEANPQAFDGNINRLKAGVSLRVPSADEIYRISRGEAFNQVRQQNAEWTGAPPPADTGPSLTLVPPDDEDLGLPYDDDAAADPVIDEPLSREERLEAAIAEIEAQDVPDQQALIDIRNDQLAELRRELAEIRGETYVPPVEDTTVADEDAVFVDEADDAMPDDEAVADDLDSLLPDDEVADEDAAAADDAVADADEEPAPVTQVRPEPEPSLVDKILGYVTGIYGIIAGAVIVVAGILFWFLRRGRDEGDDAAPWESLDEEEEIAAGALSATETLAAPKRDDDGMVVVEQESAIRSLDDTMDAPVELQESTGDTGEFGSLEDTFSSETAVNLDQQDPLAEADFHMAYGLYDQAADLVNGALEADPGDQDLLAKLCEIYFVWGNRDAFIDAAGRLKAAVGDQDNADWDKVVIMGQQIAADDALFAGASAAAATRAVDLSFDGGMGDEAALDIDFGGDAGGDEVIDLGAEEQAVASDDDGVDFLFGETATEEGGDVDLSLEATAESPTIETPIEDDDSTAEVPTAEITRTVEMPSPETTVETPTIEQQMADLGGTTELPSIDEDAMTGELPAGSEATAEINLDDLGLDVADLEATGTNEILEDIGDITGKNPEIDPNETGVRAALDPSETALGEKLDMDDSLISTGEMRLAPDETGASPSLTSEEDTDTSLEDLLDATGMTQVISEDMAVETAADVDKLLGDDEATMMASLDDDEATAAAPLADDDATTMAPSFSDDSDEEFDFAKTEALPPEAFTGGDSLDETSEIPAVAETDVDLDLDDLTAALQVSQAGDTVDMPRDDATVEQPRPNISEEAPTVALAPDDMSEDLNEARTMTEVGTKLDLARAYVDMGDPAGARSILEEVLDEGDEGQRQQAQQLLDSLPS